MDFETVFRAEFPRVARIIARVLRNPARAEELAVEVFLKWSRTSWAQNENYHGWLAQAAVRTGLDELRRDARRARRSQLFRIVRVPPTPEEVRTAREEQERVRAVLALIGRRQAELLVLRSEGLRYDELACALGIRPTSVGTFLARAEQVFRKEYIKRFGPK